MRLSILRPLTSPVLNLLLLAVLLSMTSFPSTAWAGQPRLSVLDNGLSVLVLPDQRFPLVSLRLYVRAGSAFETPEQAGISHLLEHMVFKGTSRRGPGQSAEDAEGAGGSINAATSFDYTVYMADMPAETWALGLDIIADMVFNLALDPEELEREKEVVLSELERGEDSPGSRLFKATQALVWKGTPYERPVIGFRDIVSAFTRDDILDYIGAHYQPQSMLAVVCGDVDPDAALAEVERLFGHMANDRTLTPPRPLAAPVTAGPSVRVERGPWNKAYLSVAFPAPSLHSAEAAGLDVLAHVLGGDDSARLNRTFKYTRQMVDSISMDALSLDRVGMYYLRAVLDADKVEGFWSALMRDLSRVDPADFTDAELDRARLNIEDDLLLSKETLSGLASKAGYFQFFENNPLAEDNYLSALKNVDRAQLNDLARRTLRPQALSACLLLPDSAPAGLGDEGWLLAALRDQWPDQNEAPATVAAQAEATQRRIIDLGQGRQLVLIPDQTLPYTALTMAFPGGDTLLEPDRQGLADLASRALVKGVKGALSGGRDLSATDMEDFLSDRAAELDASAGRSTFVVWAKYPSRFTPDMLGLLRDVVRHPSFEAQEVDRARREQLASISRTEDQPLGLAFRHIFPFLFRGNGYSYLHLGMPEVLENLGSDDVRGFWLRQRAMPWVMSVCGSYDADAVESLARDLARDSVDDYEFTAPVWSGTPSLDLTLADRNQAHLIVAFPVAGLESPDTPGLELLRTVLAGQGGLLFRDLRDKRGLGYTVTAMLWQTSKGGFLGLYIGTKPETLDEAMQGFKDVTGQLVREPLSDETLDRAKHLMRGDYYRDHQSLGSRSREAAGQLVRGLDPDGNAINLDLAATLTPADLQRLAAQTIDWSKAYTLRVMP